MGRLPGMDKKLLILLAVAIVAVNVMPDASKPTTKQKAPSMSTGTDVQTIRKSGLIFTYPSGVKAAPLLIVYGGLTKFKWATKEGMYGDMPESIKLRTCCLFLDHTGPSLAEAVEIGTKLCKEVGVTVTDMKAMGFSAGGIPVQNGLSVPGISFIGLIDPSTRADFINGNFGNRGRMLYNAANWGAYANIKAAMPKVAARINAQGGQAKELRMTHSAFPKAFFAAYEQELVAPVGFPSV